MAKGRKDKLIWVGTSLVIIGLWFLYPFIISSIYLDVEEQGLFGDMFGALNALFSGLAFLGLIYAILLQKEDLQNQIAEMASQRVEMEKTSNAVAMQAQLMLEQIELQKEREQLRRKRNKPYFGRFKIRNVEDDNGHNLYTIYAKYDADKCGTIELESKGGGFSFRLGREEYNGEDVVVIRLMMENKREENEGGVCKFNLCYSDEEGITYVDSYVFNEKQALVTKIDKPLE